VTRHLGRGRAVLPAAGAQLTKSRDKFAIAFAIEQPPNVDVSEVIVDPVDDAGYLVDEADVTFWGLCPQCRPEAS
jgi:hypothetical protein